MNGSEIASILIKRMFSNYIDMNKAKFLVVGIGKFIDGEYNYDTDILDFIVALEEYKRPVHVFDPYADREFLAQQYAMNCQNSMIYFGLVPTYSAIIMGVPLNEPINIKEYMRGRCIIFDFYKPNEKI